MRLDNLIHQVRQVSDDQPLREDERACTVGLPITLDRDKALHSLLEGLHSARLLLDRMPKGEQTQDLQAYFDFAKEAIGASEKVWEALLRR